MLHRVVDREAGGHVATRRVDVELDVLLRRVGLQKEQLRDDDVRDVVVDLGAEKDDPVHEQTRIDVVSALATARAFDDVREMQGRHEYQEWKVGSAPG